MKYTEGKTRSGCIRPGIEVWKLGEVIVLEITENTAFFAGCLQCTFAECYLKVEKRNLHQIPSNRLTTTEIWPKMSPVGTMGNS